MINIYREGMLHSSGGRTGGEKGSGAHLPSVSAESVRYHHRCMPLAAALSVAPPPRALCCASTSLRYLSRTLLLPACLPHIWLYISDIFVAFRQRRHAFLRSAHAPLSPVHYPSPGEEGQAAYYTAGANGGLRSKHLPKRARAYIPLCLLLNARDATREISLLPALRAYGAMRCACTTCRATQRATNTPTANAARLFLCSSLRWGYLAYQDS